MSYPASVKDSIESRAITEFKQLAKPYAGRDIAMACTSRWFCLSKELDDDILGWLSTTGYIELDAQAGKDWLEQDRYNLTAAGIDLLKLCLV